MKSIILFIALSLMAWAAPIDGFPSDPKGGTTTDRLYEVVTLAGKEYKMYASVWKPVGKKPTLVAIYAGTEVPAGMEWKKLYTWTLSDGGVNHDVSKSVLKVVAHDSDEIQFWFQDWFKYIEARSTLVLHYYPKTGKFEAQIAD